MASRDPARVGVGSRLMADLIAASFQRHLPAHCRGRLLDLGCGMVPLLLVYEPLVSENICIDWGNTPHKNQYLDFECDLAQRLPLDDGSVDTVILSDVLEHLPEPERLWGELHRVLTPGGKVLLSVPFFYWLHEQPHDYYRYTEFALRRFAEGSGFRVEVLEPMGGAPEIMADIFAKNALRVPRLGYFLARTAQGFVGWLLKTRLGRRMSRATRADFPIGYFMVAQRLGT